MEEYAPVEIPRNRARVEAGQPEEQMLAVRTRGEFWGQERAVVVTWNPQAAPKQRLALERKLDQVREELLEMWAKVREQLPHWRDPETIWERYFRLCEWLHIASDLYDLELSDEADGLVMGFRKNAYRVGRMEQRFGKTVIVTDNTDWTTAEIVSASLDRWQVEDRFCQSKESDLVGAQPVRHLHSVPMLPAGARKPRRRLETPTQTQREVLRAFGWAVSASGVLQEQNR